MANRFLTGSGIVQVAAADLSDGTSGSGNVVLATSPTLITPVLGVATITSIQEGSIILQNDTNRFGNFGFRAIPSTGNNIGAITIMPSGTSTESVLRLYNKSDASNTGTIDIDLTSTSFTFTPLNFGTGTIPTTASFASGLALSVNGNSSSGNVAVKLASTDAIIYLTSNGSDSNDGLSWGTAKATLQSAVNATPSQGGTIYFTGTIAQNTAVTLKNNVNIIGSGSAQINAVTGPATITSTLGSGDLFYFNGISDCRLSDFSINYSGTGANSCIRLTAAQRNTFERLYISGPFNNQVILDSSSVASGSCIWNNFVSVHTTGTAANGVGLLLDSTNATNKVINGNFFYNFRATGGSSGYGIKFTNSGVHNQVINENQFWASEATAASGTAIQIDPGSTRGCVFHDIDAEGSTNGFVKQTANTITFVGGNISANTTNITDSQPLFTLFIGTNIGGTTQSFAINPAGGVYVDGIGLNATTPTQNTINGTSGWQGQVSGSGIFTVNSGSFEVSKPIIFDGSSSGSTTLQSAASASGTLTLPSATDTLTGKATTDTLTNKTFNTASTGNVFQINGTGITAITGSGSVVLATSPTLITPVLGVATATSINSLTLSTSTGTFTLTNGKVLSVQNTLTLAGTDSTTLTFQGTDTYVGRATTDTLTNKTFDTAGTGNVFKINGTTVSSITGSGSAVLATSPTLVTPVLGGATCTTLNSLTLSTSTGTFTLTNGKTFVVQSGLTLSGTDSTTITFQGTDTYVGRVTTDTLSNKTLNGASSSNSVTLLNVQSNLSPVTGTGADATVFSYAIPANIVDTGKAIRVSFWVGHTTGTAGVNYKFKFGSTTISNYGSPSATGTQRGGMIIYNQGSGLATKIDDVFISGTPALQAAAGYGAGNTGDFSAGFTISLTFSVANTDAITPQFWLVELIQ